MSMKAIKLLLLNIVFLCTVQLAFSQQNIIPKKKPVLSAEIFEKKISQNVLIPQKKPILIPKAKMTEIKKVKEDKKISKIQGVIMPESKPLIVKKGRAKFQKNQNIIMKEISIMQNKQFNLWKKVIGKMQ